MYGRVGLLMAAETEGSKLAIGPAVPGTGVVDTARSESCGIGGDVDGGRIN